MISNGSIYLLPIEKENLQQLQHWRNDSELRKYFREFKELSMEHQERWFTKIQSLHSNDFMFGIYDKKNSELIGAGGLCSVHWIYRNADLSFYIGKDSLYADPFYAKDTVLSLIKFAFNDLNLEKIWCEIYENDEKKINILSQIGFTKEGLLRHSSYKNGKYINSFYFGLLKNDTIKSEDNQQNKD